MYIYGVFAILADGAEGEIILRLEFITLLLILILIPKSFKKEKERGNCSPPYLLFTCKTSQHNIS